MDFLSELQESKERSGKSAREIAEEAEAHGEILIEKPVSLAINDFKNGDYKLIVPKEEEEEAVDEE